MRTAAAAYTQVCPQSEVSFCHGRGHRPSAQSRNSAVNGQLGPLLYHHIESSHLVCLAGGSSCVTLKAPPCSKPNLLATAAAIALQRSNRLFFVSPLLQQHQAPNLSTLKIKTKITH
jgi:hypothetical protein